MRECELNLIPSDVIEDDVLRQRIRFWIFVIIGCLLFLVSVSILVKKINKSIEKDITELEVISKGLSSKMTVVRQLEIREQELLNIKGKIQQLSQKGPAIDIFTAIDKAISDNITLTHLEWRYHYSNISGAGTKKESGSKGYFTSGSPAKSLSSQAMNADSLILQGVATSNTDLAVMITQLSGQSLFQKVDLKYSKKGEAEKGKTIMFEIECGLSKGE